MPQQHALDGGIVGAGVEPDGLGHILALDQRERIFKAEHMGAIRRARFYHVFDHKFPTTTIDEDDFAAELSRLGFPVSDLRIEVAHVPEFAQQGFDSICCVRAVKTR